MIIYKYCVYVIELNNDPMLVYVGQTCLTPKERLAKHRAGIRSARCVKNAKSVKLRPDLYSGYANLKTRAESEASEAMLAEKLRKMGYTVKGGH